ncbi:MAG: MBL fold metallo-hydrolase [Candidatus Methylacidiphilales bacterium]
MLRLLLILIVWIISMGGQMPASAQDADSSRVVQELLGETGGNPKENKDGAPVPEKGTLVQWFGHAFVYLTSDSGIRIAINPFSDGLFDYRIPNALPADIVLISCESADYSGGKELFGLPQVFRSSAGLGLNNANGLTFRGTETFRDSQRGREMGSNTVYSFMLDGIRYCHIGSIGHTLDFNQRSKIGQVDVLFLPVGNPAITSAQLWSIAEGLKAKWVVPMGYRTEKTGNLGFRSLEDFDLSGRAVKKLDSSEMIFSSEALPTEPTVLLFNVP